MDRQIPHQSIMNLLGELWNERNKISEGLNDIQTSKNKQNYMISDLKNDQANFSKELKTVKEEISIKNVKKVKYISSILEMSQSLSQNNQNMETSYKKLERIKKNFDKTIQNNENVNSTENNQEECQKEVETNNTMSDYLKTEIPDQIEENDDDVDESIVSSCSDFENSNKENENITNHSSDNENNEVRSVTGKNFTNVISVLNFFQDLPF